MIPISEAAKEKKKENEKIKPIVGEKICQILAQYRKEALATTEES